MIVKPVVTFLSKDSDAQLIGRTEAILVGMTDNPDFLTPSPALALIAAAKDEFAAALAAAQDGGRTATAVKNAKRAALVTLLRLLANYVQVASRGDLTVLVSSGFPYHKPQRQPVGVLPAPGNLTVTLGPRTGELQAVAPPVHGAAIYNWRVSLATAPEVWLQTVQTTAARNIFTGLTPGVVYCVQANVVNTAGPSDWSSPVSQMAV